MKIAIIGSRNLTVNNIEDYLPKETTCIISGGAKGIDTCAREFAKQKGLDLKEYLPDYKRYGKAAPLYRNVEIITVADFVIAFWDGKSRGTKYSIDKCEEMGKPLKIIYLPPKNL